MAQTVDENVASELVVYLVDGSGDAVSGLAFSDVVVEYKKYDSAVFVAKVLSAEDWVEVGSGVYTIAFTAAELDTPGSFVLKVTGASISQFVEVIDITDTNDTDALDISTCDITGHVYDVAGQPVEGAAVVARILGFPTTVDSQAALSDTTVTVRTDENGAFTLTLVREAYVDIAIAKASYRRQLTVPDSASAVLFSIA